MTPTNQSPSLWKRLQDKFNAIAIAMDFDPTEYLLERNRILECELALLKANIHVQHNTHSASDSES